MPPVSPAPFNLAAHVLAAGARVPDRIALTLAGETASEDWTFGALIAAVRGTGTGLLRAGLVPGDVVLMRRGNTVDFPLASLGALAVGLVPVPTAAALTEPEVGRLIDIVRPRLILHDPQVACPPGHPSLSRAQLRGMRALPPAAWHMGDPDRPGYIVFTSGTSGTPTAVLHAHRAILGRAPMFDGWYGLRADDRVLHAGAFNWTYTLGTGLLDPWTRGATALIPAGGTPAAALPGLLARHAATIFAAAPGVFRQMLAAGPFPAMPALRHGLSAGEKMSADVHADWRRATGLRVHEAFGMSECSTFISSCPEIPAAPGAIGLPQPGRRVSLRDDAGPVPPGSAGTIAIHRSDPGLMLRYVGAPGQTAARFQDVWFMTGDIGIADGAGQITYLGRGDDMMNAGGFRVSPLEVEAALAGAEGLTGIGVTEVTVKTGTRVIAAFYTAPAALDDDALRAYARERLARYKQPRLYIHLPALPQGANGKLQRRALRTSFEARIHD